MVRLQGIAITTKNEKNLKVYISKISNIFYASIEEQETAGSFTGLYREILSPCVGHKNSKSTFTYVIDMLNVLMNHYNDSIVSLNNFDGLTYINLKEQQDILSVNNIKINATDIPK